MECIARRTAAQYVGTDWADILACRNAGRQYDKDGNLRQWWNNDTIEAFRERAQCIIDQYSDYVLEPLGMHVSTADQWRRQDLVRGGVGCAPSPENFSNFYIKMVSSGAFWVAISYRLAACFTGIGSTRGVEIYWRSFRHFGNYNYSLRKTVGKKMTKIGQKLIKDSLQNRWPENALLDRKPCT